MRKTLRLTLAQLLWHAISYKMRHQFPQADRQAATSLIAVQPGTYHTHTHTHIQKKKNVPCATTPSPPTTPIVSTGTKQSKASDASEEAGDRPTDLQLISPW
jgi:hypothetical protein